MLCGCTRVGACWHLRYMTGLEKYSRSILRDQVQDQDCQKNGLEWSRDQDRGLEDYITGIARGGMSVRLSVTLRYCIKTKKASVMISSPFESVNILVSENIRHIPQFDRGHPERGRFMRLGWVQTGEFGDFSTNKPPYLRNGAR